MEVLHSHIDSRQGLSPTARGLTHARGAGAWKPLHWLLLPLLTTVFALTSLSRPALAAETLAPLQLKGAPEPQLVSPLLASDLPQALDKYTRAARELDGLSVKFQQNYQRFIRTLDQLSRADKPLKATPGCLIQDLAEPYLTALGAWEAYHVQARSVRTLQRRLQLYDQGGYSVGLTPDLQDRLKRVLEDYERIRQEHVNLQALIRNQVEGEIRRIGCNPEDVTAPAPVEVASKEATPLAPATGKSARNDKATVPPVSENRRSAATLNDDSEASSTEPSTAPLPVPEQLLADERMLPLDNQDTLALTPVPFPGMTNGPEGPATPAPLIGPEDKVPGEDKDAADKDPLSREGATTPAVKDSKTDPPREAQATPTPAPPAPTATPTPIPEGLKVHFSVDNRQCRQSVQVFLDGGLIGTVAGEATSTFAATEGKHRLCLGQDGQGKACSQTNDYIRVILYDGFAVRPRC